MKTCTVCRETKPLDEFHLNRKSADGRQSRCKSCANATARQWNADNRDRKNATARESREAWTPERREQETAKHRRWREAHAEQVKASNNKAYAKTPEGQAARLRARENWKRRDPRGWYRGVLKRNYGLTLEDFDAMVLAQEGRCAICNEPMIRVHEPHVDHCHTSGKVRALLCSHCNVGLGNFRENLSFMSAAMDYLRAHRDY